MKGALQRRACWLRLDPKSIDSVKRRGKWKEKTLKMEEQRYVQMRQSGKLPWKSRHMFSYP